MALAVGLFARRVGLGQAMRSVGSSAPSLASARPSAFHSLSGQSLVCPRIALAAVRPSLALGNQETTPDSGAIRWDSTKRKRAKKMNKHKYQKMKKRMRNLTAKNVK